MQCFNPKHLQSLDKPVYPHHSRAIVITIFLVAILIAVCCLCSIEIISTVKGKVAPLNKSHEIRSTRQAQVEQLLVQEGQNVKQSQILIKLNTREQGYQLLELKLRQQNNESKHQSLTALIENLDATNKPKLNSKSSLIEASNYLQVSGRYAQEMKLQLEAFEHQRQDISESIQILNTDIDLEQTRLTQYQAQLPLNHMRVEASKTLKSQGYVSSLESLEHQSLLQQQQSQILLSKKTIEQLHLKIAGLVHDKQSARSQLRWRIAKQLNELETQNDALQQQIKVLESQIHKSYIRSPIDGYAQEVVALMYDSYVDAGQTLLKVIPIDNNIIVRAQVPTSERGFLAKGQSARVKVEAYPYTRYGSLPAQVRLLSRDSTLNKKGQLVYPIEVSLLSKTLVYQGQQQSISYGMAVDVDVITGHRTLISFFTDPISRTFSNALSER